MSDPTVISDKSGIVWPALPGRRDSEILSLLYQHQQSEWWPAERLEAAQFDQLGRVLAHAWETVPFYRDRLAQAGYEPGIDVDDGLWRRIPPLRRAELQDAGEGLFSGKVPEDHGRVSETSSSGSTGRPVTVRVTQLASLFQRAFVLRNHRWQNRDAIGRKAVIRNFNDTRTRYPAGLHAKGWGAYIDSLFPTGTTALLEIATRTAEQVEWLRRVDPDYLITFPHNLLELARYCAAQGIALPNLKSIETISETLPDGVRGVVREAWDAPLFDVYSAEEVGMVAAQCPDTENYHVFAEGLRVEVLDEDGRPGAPGELGRVVVTPLHNFATPLIRYDIGDYAEAGAPCTCGRGLPTLTRIAGRSRNMMVGPDGTRFRPALGSRSIADIAPIRQFQLVQRSVDTVEFRLVAERPLSGAEEGRLADLLSRRIGFPICATFSYHEEIPRGAGGKYEDFISDVARRMESG